MLKSELDRSARAALDPSMEAVSLRALRGRSAAWRSDDRRLFAWIVNDSKARDPYKGGAFTIEFELSHDGSWMKKLSGRTRLGGLITAEEFESLLSIQRDVVRSLKRPPASHVELLPESLRARYLASFDPPEAAVRGELWLRYLSDDHLAEWWRALAPLVPALVARTRTLDPHKLYRESDRFLSP